MEKTDILTMRIDELEERIDYLEKKFNINQNSAEILFPKTVEIADAMVIEQNSTKEDE